MATRRTKAELEDQLKVTQQTLASLRDTLGRTENELRRATDNAVGRDVEHQQELKNLREKASIATRAISDERDTLAEDRARLLDEVVAHRTRIDTSAAEIDEITADRDRLQGVVDGYEDLMQNANRLMAQASAEAGNEKRRRQRVERLLHYVIKKGLD